jgi:hypothetical protein
MFGSSRIVTWFIPVVAVIWLARQPNVSPEITAACVVATVGLFQLDQRIKAEAWLQREQQRRHAEIQVEEELRKQKAPVYSAFFNFWLEFLMQAKQGNPQPQADVLIFFSEFTGKLMAWGSDDVIRCYLEFRRLPQISNLEEDQSDRNVELMYKLERLFLAFRRDLRHSTEVLKPGDILSLFVNDMEKYPPPAKLSQEPEHKKAA